MTSFGKHYWLEHQFFTRLVERGLAFTKKTNLRPVPSLSTIAVGNKEILLYCIYVRTKDMYQKNLLAAILVVVALASITAMKTVPFTFASSNGEPLAPGQFGEGSVNKNPSNDFPPPGNPDQDDDRGRSNPGQCQGYYNDPQNFEIDKKVAHEICHGKG